MVACPWGINHFPHQSSLYSFYVYIFLFSAVQYSDRSARYGQRYRRRSQESDSDESPGRSDHNSSSERDDAAIDKIADLLMEIQDNMKKILERLKRLETSLQQSHSTVSITSCNVCFLWIMYNITLLSSAKGLCETVTVYVRELRWSKFIQEWLSLSCQPCVRTCLCIIILP